jgi:hypothetical protein
VAFSQAQQKERKFETKQNLTLCYYELIQQIVNERKTQSLIVFV